VAGCSLRQGIANFFLLIWTGLEPESSHLHRPSSCVAMLRTPSFFSEEPCILTEFLFCAFLSISNMHILKM
jgi:hypothetical protein